MASLQASIGAFNDVVDAPGDAGRSPASPSRPDSSRPRSGRAVAAVAAVVGIALAAPRARRPSSWRSWSSAIGYGYDLRFKGTAWSWVPFAVGIPLLPVFGWLGAAGSLPAIFAVLLPVAVLAGTALAIANARVDVERDAAAGLDSVAVRLGLERAWVIHAALLAIVVGAALWTLRPPAGPRLRRPRGRGCGVSSSPSASSWVAPATARGESGPGRSRRSGWRSWRRVWLAAVAPLRKARPPPRPVRLRPRRRS